jgi:LysM domain
LSLTLKRGVEVLVGLVLAVAMLAMVLPAVAEAQEEKGVVVRPGDSLWSISEQRLGPEATPQQIDREVERLWALNRERIGADPNLILPGQKLSLPSVGELSQTPPGSPTKATTRPQAEDEATRGSARRATTEHVAKGETSQGSKKTVKTVDDEATDRAAADRAAAGEAAPERVTLPEAADAEAVPTVRPLSPSNASSAPSSWPIGLVIVMWALLTVLLAFLVWGLLTTVVFLALRAGRRRKVRRARTLPTVFGTNYARFDPLLGFEETLGPPPVSGADEVTGNGLDGRALLSAMKVRRARIQRGRTARDGRRLLPGGRATPGSGVYYPDIRRHLRRTTPRLREANKAATKFDGRVGEARGTTRRR